MASHAQRTTSASRSRSPRREGAAAAAAPVASTASAASAASAEVPAALQSLKALMLGLERRPDRRARCEAMLQKEVPWLGFEFFPATDGKVDKIPDTEVAETWNTKNNSLYGEYEDVKDAEGKLLHSKQEFEDPGVEYHFSPGERGCAHSHHRMWRRVAASSEPVLILEDDVELVFERTGGGVSSGATFTERLALGLQQAAKTDIDVLYLGWSGFRDGNYRHHKASRGKKNPIIRKAEYVWTTVAYVLWPAGARKLLEAAQPMNQPVDNFMAWECREGRLKAYVLLDSGDDNSTWSGGIVNQVDFTGDSDIKKSDGGHQDDDPTLFLAAAAARAAGS